MCNMNCRIISPSHFLFFMPKTMNASSDFTILPPKVPGPRSKLQALEEGGENVVTLASPKTVGVLTHPCFFLGVV